MKKIVLNKPQVDKLMDKVISEQYMDGRYQQDIKCDILFHNVTYKGHEIDWINDIQTKLSFDIEMEARSYGIKGIYVTGIRGPETIELEVSYYVDDSGETAEEIIELPIDWSEADKQEGDLGWIGIDPDVDISLENDQDGNIRIGRVSMYVKEL